MKRDMELMRKILFKIEEEYKPGHQFISDLAIDGFNYDRSTIAEHCDLLCQQGFVKEYVVTAVNGHRGIHSFRIGNLTAQAMII